jgi:hypothetical protein
MKLVSSAVTAAVLVMIAPLPPVSAQGAAQSEPPAFTAQANMLKPGQWVWAPELASEGPVLVYVDLNRQVATVYRNGIRMAVSTISSGRPGFATPTGVFTILQRDVDHHSSTYNDAPMPYTERLTWQGVALHAGGLPGYPSSHGCVHLPLDFARDLFGIESLGGTVIITGGYDIPNNRPAAGMLEPAAAGANPPAPLAGGQQFSWNPSASASGPVSIIVSSADQQVVVLRNGIEIGRSRAEVQHSPGTNVMTYAAGKPDHWIEVGASGPGGGDPVQATSDGVEQTKLPTAFATAMRSVIAPGTTLLTTDAPVSAQSTGPQATLLDADDAKK